MEPFRKYAFLPDVDDAPNVYETVAPVSLPVAFPPKSQSTATSDSDGDNRDNPSVVRHKLRPEQARELFGSNRVDATDVDFSDRVVDRRKAYRVRNGKRTHHGSLRSGGQAELNDEEPETIDARIARLLREVEEVQGVFEATKATQAADENMVNNDIGQTLDTVLQLNTVLKNLQLKSRLERTKTEKSRLDLRVDTPDVQRDTEPKRPGPETQNQSFSQAQESAVHLLVQAIALESRLTALESAIGSSHVLITQDAEPDTTKTMLTSMAMLETQFASLSGTTSPSLEALSSQITKLTQDAMRLEEARNAAARAAYDAIKAKSLGIQPAPISAINVDDATVVAPENLELVAKIDALHASLSTIETVAPILPQVIDRLKSLRVLHADAATAEHRLTEVEQRQSKISGELTAWREGLQKVEEAMQENAGTSNSNMLSIEGWVRELEKRMEALQ